MLVQNHIFPSSSSCLSLKAFMVLMCLTCVCFCSQKVDLNCRGKKNGKCFAYLYHCATKSNNTNADTVQWGETVMPEGLWQSLLLGMPLEKVQARMRGIKSGSSKQIWFHEDCSEIVVFHPSFQMKRICKFVLAPFSFWPGLWLKMTQAKENLIWVCPPVLPLHLWQ